MKGRVLVFLALSSTACASARIPSGYCAPVASYAVSLHEDDAPAEASRVERIAALLGVHDAWVDGGKDAALRAHALERIEATRIEVAAMVAELDCEGERADQIARYLAGIEADATKGLTVTSIVLSALTAIGSAILARGDASRPTQEWFAIGGGAASATTGVATLAVHPHADVAHARNLLADVWNGPASSRVYPAVVWAYLTRAPFSNEGRRPIREEIVERWKGLRTLDDAGKASLFFGEGGSYDADDLRVRAAMLDEVKAEVALLDQEIAALAAALFAR